jgi:hypothetical protein
VSYYTPRSRSTPAFLETNEQIARWWKRNAHKSWNPERGCYVDHALLAEELVEAFVEQPPQQLTLAGIHGQFVEECVKFEPVEPPIEVPPPMPPVIAEPGQLMLAVA